MTSGELDMPLIPVPQYRQADHPRLKVNEWKPEDGAEPVNDFILMSKSVTNCYLVASEAGDVVINTGLPGQGELHRKRFEELLGRRLKVSKVVFTQDHVDQTGGWEAFADPGVDLIGQRDLERLAEERTRLGPFFAMRNRRTLRAIQEKMAREGSQVAKALPAPVRLTTTFSDRHRFEIGGRTFDLISTPSGETLNAICIWLPAERILFTGNYMSAVFGTMPNFYTLRGDRQRSVPGYLHELDGLIDLGADLLVTGHGEPLAGDGNIREALTRLRDAIRYMHDETVRLMIDGQDLHSIMQAVELPPELKLSPLGRGPTRWYVRSIWEEYTGWFRQELTSELYATPATAVWPTLAQMAGGARTVAKKADDLLRAGDAEKALHLVEVAIAAEPDDRLVRTIEARILVHLIDQTGGIGFDEIGWLESKLSEARAIIESNGPS